MSSKITPHNKTPEQSKLKEKEFKIRNSPLIDKLENNEDIRTIYTLFTVIFSSLLFNTIIHDLLNHGSINIGQRLIILGFNKLHIVIPIWICLYCWTCLTFFCFHLWAKLRTSIVPKKVAIYDSIWLLILVFHYILPLFMIQNLIMVFKFHPGSAAILILEVVRFVMKEHSFVRSNIPKVLNHKIHSEQILNLPNFRQFCYFSFAPTLLYRDSYPRTERIRWKFVFHNIGEIFAIILLLSLVIERFLVEPYSSFGLRKFSKKEIILSVLGNTFPGVFFMLGGFYSVIHSCQNAFAEMLRFGDRKFYEEWWISQSFSQYYRTWNCLVHDWLYTYLYKDIYEFCPKYNKVFGKSAAFLVSALVHEWILSNTLGLFLPINFVQFFIAGTFLAMLNIMDLKLGNFLVWYSIVFGSCIQVNLYALEFFARKNCPFHENSGLDFFKPRFLFCDSIE